MENLSQKEIDYSIAKARVNKLKKFYISLIVYLTVLSLFIFLNYRRHEEITILGSRIPVVFWIWGIFLFIRAVKIFFLNSDWERKIMNKELKQNKNGN